MRHILKFLLLLSLGNTYADNHPFFEQTKEIENDQPHTYVPGDFQLVKFTAKWCGPCQTWSRQHKSKLEAKGVDVKEVDIDDADFNRDFWGLPRSSFSIPCFLLRVRNYDEGKDGSTYSRILRSGSNSNQKKNTRLVRWGSVSSTIVICEIDRLNTKWNVSPTVAKNEKKRETKSSTTQVNRCLKEQIVYWQNVKYYPQRYGRCSSKSCPMCPFILNPRNWIRTETVTIRQKEEIEERGRVASLAKSPVSVRDQALASLRLQSGDMLAEIGCGDCTVLIEAVKRFGCSGVGVENDPDKFAEAERNVAAAGLENRITLIYGDALDFNPMRHGVTAVYVFLTDDLLSDLVPVFRKVDRVVSINHPIPGLETVKFGDVYFWEPPKNSPI